MEPQRELIDQGAVAPVAPAEQLAVGAIAEAPPWIDAVERILEGPALLARAQQAQRATILDRAREGGLVAQAPLAVQLLGQRRERRARRRPAEHCDHQDTVARGGLLGDQASAGVD